MDPLELLNKKKDDEIETMNIKELFRYRILLTFNGKAHPLIHLSLEITDFDFQLPTLKRNSLSLEYSILNVTKTYRLHVSPQQSPNDYSLDSTKLHIPINKIRMYYFFAKD